MTTFKDIQGVVVSFTNRDGVPTALIIDGSVPEADMAASIMVDDDGMTSSFSITGVMPNGAGYSFRSLEDYELSWRRHDEDGHHVAKAPELGRVGKIIVTAVALAILTPFVGILWAWGAQVVRGMGLH